MLPTVSIIIPCRNEERFIGQCIESIIANDYPGHLLEVLVMDGMSEDGTRKVVEKYLAADSNIKIFANQRKTVSAALNTGIRKSTGEIIMRMDAHCLYKRDYISNCVRYLGEYEADNVGGICITMPADGSTLAKSIAVALAHPFGVGNSYFRIGSDAIKYVDTVPFGCYKKEVFQKIGLFDEDLIRNQDDEFNLRLKKNGGKILLVPDIVSVYFARESLLKLWKMFFQYGYFKPLVALKVGAILTVRQLIPPFFIAGLIFSGSLAFWTNFFIYVFLSIAGPYVAVNVVTSVWIAFRKGLKSLLTLPLAFATLHFSYGLGYIKGFIDFHLLKRNKFNDISLSR